MRVAIIGAGIIGVTTAYELRHEGHEVTVFERRGSVAAETSFANAGVIAPGYVTPWAGPGMPSKVLRHLLSRHSPVRLHPTLNPATLGWLWKWWRACRTSTWQANRTNMQRLALFSRERLHAITHRLQLDYERGQGYLVLLRSAKELKQAKPGLNLLTELGTRFHLVDAARCREIEPGLNADTELHAGIHLEDDEVGNCREFAMLMRGEAQGLGARFRFHTQVLRIEPGAKPGVVHLYSPPADSTQLTPGPETPATDGPHTEPMPFEPLTERFDAVVVCAAMGAPALLRPHGVHLPLMAVHGYSITAPLRRHENHPDLGPRSALMDERYKVAISRLGARIRIAGSAEIGGDPATHRGDMLDTLYKVLNDWFPAAANLKQAQRWKGARPMLPDGPPVLGPSGLEGIWLNLGHGSSGWALACGSASVLNDLLSGRAAAIDTRGLGIERLRR
jgi:D-amino-acid dehydrogenase